MSENIAQKLIVEALGAFALCFFSIGAVVLTQGQDIVAIGLATGLAIGIMVAAGGHISGGHFNPAVTAGMLATKRISVPDGIAYIIAQAVGAVLGAGAITLAYLDVDRNRKTRRQARDPWIHRARARRSGCAAQFQHVPQNQGDLEHPQSAWIQNACRRVVRLASGRADQRSLRVGPVHG